MKYVFVWQGTYLKTIQSGFIFKSEVEKNPSSLMLKSTLVTTTTIFHVSLISSISGNEKNSSNSNFIFEIMRFRYTIYVELIRGDRIRITVLPIDKNMFSVYKNEKTSIKQTKSINIVIVVLIFIIVQESDW